MAAIWHARRFCRIVGGTAQKHGRNAMDLGLGGRKALITGASKGIGRATARVLVARTAADLAAARDVIRAQHNVAVSVVPLDLSEGDAARGLARDFPDV